MKFYDIFFPSFAPAAIQRAQTSLSSMFVRSWHLKRIPNFVSRLYARTRLALWCILSVSVYVCYSGFTFINELDSRVRNTNESTFMMFMRARIRSDFWLEMMIFILKKEKKNCNINDRNEKRFQQSIHFIHWNVCPARHKMKWKHNLSFISSFSLVSLKRFVLVAGEIQIFQSFISFCSMQNRISSDSLFKQDKRKLQTKSVFHHFNSNRTQIYDFMQKSIFT